MRHNSLQLLPKTGGTEPNMSASNQDKRVVVIEDDPEMIELVKLILAKDGFKVSGAGNGREGLETIQQVEPQVVLLDLMMPDMAGWEVYQSMKANEKM